jgi:hypothetical protein
MGKKAITLLQSTDEEFYEGMGVYFVDLTIQLGFAKLIKHLGRELRDFFLNLDNLHDYLKFQFPRMKPPSFFVQDETDKCTSHIVPNIYRIKFQKIASLNTSVVFKGRLVGLNMTRGKFGRWEDT